MRQRRFLFQYILSNVVASCMPAPQGGAAISMSAIRSIANAYRRGNFLGVINAIDLQSGTWSWLVEDDRSLAPLLMYAEAGLRTAFVVGDPSSRSRRLSIVGQCLQSASQISGAVTDRQLDSWRIRLSIEYVLAMDPAKDQAYVASEFERAARAAGEGTEGYARSLQLGANRLFNKRSPLHNDFLRRALEASSSSFPVIRGRCRQLQAVIAYANRDYAAAISSIDEAVGIMQSRLPQTHADIADALAARAALERNLRLLDQARSDAQRAFSIRKQCLPPSHQDILAISQILASIHQASDNLPLAIKQIRQHESLLTSPASSQEIAALQHDLGLYSQEANLFDAAKTAYGACKAFLDNQPAKSTSILSYKFDHNYALFEYLEGTPESIARARKRLESVLASPGFANHPFSANCLTLMAEILWATDDLNGALDRFIQAEKQWEKEIASNLLATFDLRGLLLARDRAADLILNFVLALPAGFSRIREARQLLYSNILRRKSRGLHQAATLRDLARASIQPEVAKALSQLLSYESELSAVISGQAASDQLLQIRLGRLAAERRLAALLQTSQPGELQDLSSLVAAKLLPDQVLLEFFQFSIYTKKGFDLASRWNPTPHYGLMLLSNEGPMQVLDLGPSDEIDRLIQTFHSDLQCAQSNRYQVSGVTLAKKLWTPVEKLIPNSCRVLIGTESNIAFVPFPALPSANGLALLRSGHSFQLIFSGRELLRLENLPTSKNPAELLGDPDVSNSQYEPLPWSAFEIAEVKKVLPMEHRSWTRKKFTLSSVKDLDAPSILLLSTHGTYLGQFPFARTCRSATVPKSKRLLRPSCQTPPLPANPEEAMANSAILLSEASARSSCFPKRLFSALEVAGLPLRGTQLVVLASCLGAFGGIVRKEAIYGLPRAFFIAGVHNVCVSIWSIDDKATAKLVPALISHALHNPTATLGECLRQAQLQLADSQPTAHPYYWAGMQILGGNQSIRI